MIRAVARTLRKRKYPADGETPSPDARIRVFVVPIAKRSHIRRWVPVGFAPGGGLQQAVVAALHRAMEARKRLVRTMSSAARLLQPSAGSGRISGSPLLWLLSSGEAEESDSPSGETGSTIRTGWYEAEVS